MLLEIDGTQQEIAQTMIRKLCGLYPNVPGLDRWIKGLYCERSVFNHGIGQGSATGLGGLVQSA